ncbi:MAG: tyrosine-type recombinase/integrase [Chloroflexi bacterium]|nr:tyrosine-type recombinase/integrase [Chloroflexota bacterium]
MRGHIVKRGKASYSIAVSLGKDPNTGKYKYQWVSVKGTKKDAEKRLAEILHELDTGTFLSPDKTTVREFLDRWLVEYARPNLSPRTSEGYEHIFRKYLIPVLGNLTLTQAKPEHLQRYYSERLTGGLSPQTVRHHHAVLHTALQTAVEWGLLARNVADAVTPPRAQRSTMQTWTEGDIARFLEAAKNTPHYALFYTALFTGMRRSELLALRWSDVDLLLCQISVSRSLHVLTGGKVVFRMPKSAKGKRMIALSPSAVSVLREHGDNQKGAGILLGMPQGDDDLVFSTLEGKPLLPNSVTHAWIRLVRRAGVKYIRLHDARHTHASIMLKQGIHPKIVQERLGHSTIAITLDTYSHVAPGLQQAAANRFDEVLAGTYNEREKQVAASDY